MRWALVGLVVGSTILADALQVIGMRSHGEIQDFGFGALRRALALLSRNRYIIASTLMMALSFFAFLKLLSVADLSFAVPATAASYVFETIVAKYLLKEHIDWKRWAGTGLVACGVALLAL